MAMSRPAAHQPPRSPGHHALDHQHRCDEVGVGVRPEQQKTTKERHCQRTTQVEPREKVCQPPERLQNATSGSTVMTSHCENKRPPTIGNAEDHPDRERPGSQQERAVLVSSHKNVSSRKNRRCKSRCTEHGTQADPHGGRRTHRVLPDIGRRNARNHPALGHWQDCDELWVISECVHVLSSNVSSSVSASDRTKNLITRSDSVIESSLCPCSCVVSAIPVQNVSSASRLLNLCQRLHEQHDQLLT